MKMLTQIILLTLITSVVHSQDLEGQWSGALNVQGTQFRIMFHITRSDNQYKAMMDSPDQQAMGIPVPSINFNLPEVKIEMANIGMTYEGIMSGNIITGRWMQSGQTFPLILEKTKTVAGAASVKQANQH